MAKKKEEPKDEVKEQFKKTTDKINLINMPKSILGNNGELPTQFKANGTMYYVKSPQEIFNIGRQKAYWDLETCFALNQTPMELFMKFQKTYHNQIRLMNVKDDKQWIELQNKNLRDCLNNMDSFKESLTKRHAPAYYMCTLFIVKDGEDLGAWDWITADKKIDDWTEEGIKPTDFFRIALSSSKSSQEIIGLIYQK